MRRPLLACAAAAALALSLLGGGTASADDSGKDLPVPYTFLPTVIAGGMPGANAPGTNDWDCTPSAAHPDPVILVHGTFGNRATNWQTYGPLLKNEGYCVFALNYGMNSSPGELLGGQDRIEDSAAELADFVQQVLAATGAEKVDLIGHSQGTVMPQYYVRFLGGAEYVDDYIGLASAWHGTLTNLGLPALAAAFGFDAIEASPVCKACLQLTPPSEFLDSIRDGGVATEGITYTNIVTRYDNVVIPWTSGIEEGMTNIVVQDTCAIDFSDHLSVVSSRTAADLVLNALDPEHPRKVRCSFHLPSIGS
ncbi:alpha/beta fold hydrolase [Nocardioides sp. AE5]|uniref:esterase/lipase family protein n=1 Tax=Nocardioides sp. AE5 TaxID=2962573 RepID=UPI0028810BC1|nr:alpha/beta fold hydrolase [Nocardioides sp. AE5]MDT0201037.1 alpha/beta fold hydrolase [Nocardioides sp. AE5]